MMPFTFYKVMNRAMCTLNSLWHNLNKCSTNVKQNACLTIVRPFLKCAACVWDPYQEYLIYDLEKIQQHAARWVLSDYKYYSSVITACDRYAKNS